MTDFTIEPIDTGRPDFAGRVTGLNTRRSADAAKLETAMDHYAVLVFKIRIFLMTSSMVSPNTLVRWNPPPATSPRRTNVACR